MGPPPSRNTELPAFDLVFARLRAATELKNQQDLAQALGITPPTVTDAKKRGAFPLEWAYRLAQAFSLSLDRLLTPEDADPPGVREPAPGPWPRAPHPGIHLVPAILPRIDARSGLPLADSGDPGLPFGRETLARLGTPGMMVTLRVAGRALEPELRDGDTALVDTARTRPEPGRYFALAVGGAIVLRLVEAADRGLMGIAPGAPRLPAVALDGTVPVIGRVVWWSREDP